MSNTYYLVCMDCKTGVLLGKVVPAQYDNIETYGFDQLGYQEFNKWKSSYDQLINIQKSLMIHRTHELRVLPDTVDKYATDVGIPHSFPGFDDDRDPESNRLLFLSTDVGTPNPEFETNNLSEELIEKLKKF